jgi:DNA-binding Lrp family transcriptional regulator
MTVFSIPEGREEEAGRRAASFPEVSHCYLREVPAHWPYPLFAMIHAADRESCRRSAARVAEAAGAAGYRLLFSTKEYKKQRIVYEPEAL